MGFSIYSNPTRCILVVKDSQRIFITDDPSRTELFSNVMVESIDDIVHPEKSIVVIRAILIFPKMDALYNLTKPIAYYYSTKKGGIIEYFSILHRKEIMDGVSGVKIN